MDRRRCDEGAWRRRATRSRTPAREIAQLALAAASLLCGGRWRCSRSCRPERTEARQETRFLDRRAGHAGARSRVDLARRPMGRVFGARRGVDRGVRPSDRAGSASETGRHGRRGPAVLVAGQPLDCVLRGRHAEEDRGDGRTSAEHLRDARPAGRHLECRRRDRICVEQGIAARAGRRRRAVGDRSRRRLRQNQREPYFLPDGKQYLFLAGRATAPRRAIYAGSLDSTDTTRLVAANSNAGVRRAGLPAVPPPGNAVRAVVQSAKPRDSAAKRFGSPTGSRTAPRSGGVRRVAHWVADLPQQSAGAGGSARCSRRQRSARGAVLWVNPAGCGRGVAGRGGSAQAAAAAGWAGVDLSPDGKRAAVHRHDGEGGDVWIFEAGQTHAVAVHVRRHAGQLHRRSGRPMAHASRSGRGGTANGDSTSSSRTTRAAKNWCIESDLPDDADELDSGDRLVYWTRDPKTFGDIWSVAAGQAAETRSPSRSSQTPADERNPQVSPDGKWIAYSSNETGRSEIYVRPFPDGPGRIRCRSTAACFRGGAAMAGSCTS